MSASTRLNVTVDDTSPLIHYFGIGNWSQDPTDADGGSSSYTEDLHAGLEFHFEGDWIAAHGSRNPSHGNFTVELDESGERQTYNGWAAPSESSSARTTTLFSMSISPGHHKLRIRNAGWTTLDIDSISWSCNLGGPNAPPQASLQNSTDHDTSSAFTYFPHGSWNMNGSGMKGHSTSQLNASVNYTFSGDAVALYGSTFGDTQYSVQRNGSQPKQFVAKQPKSSSRVLLYFGQNFGSGNHTITIVNEGSGSLAVNSAIVHRVVGAATSSSSSSLSGATTPTIPTNPVKPRPVPAGTIAAVSIASVLFLLGTAFIWFLLRRNKALWMRLQRGYMVQSQFDASPPYGITPLPYSSPPPPRTAKTVYSPLAPAEDAEAGAPEDESFEPGPLDRATTQTSQLTASTLVAQDGSADGYRGLKPLRLASRLGFSTPTSSQTSLIPPLPDLRRSRRRESLSRSISTRRLLRNSEDLDSAQYYAFAAARGVSMRELSEESDGSPDDILRQPLTRHEPSNRF